MTREEAIKKLQKQKAEYLEEWVDFSGVAEAYDMAIKALEDIERWRTWSYTYDNLISRQDAIEAMWKALYAYEDLTEKQFMEHEELELEDWFQHRIFVQRMHEECMKAVESLPSRLTEYKTFCGVPIEEAMRIVQEHKADPLCALADRVCPFQGKEFAWCLTCPHISEEDRELVRKAVEGSEPKTGEWIRNNNGTYSCSVCHSWIPEEQHYYARYCLYCGARILREDGEA